MKTRIATFSIIIASLASGYAGYCDDKLPETYDGLSVTEVVDRLPNDSYALVRSTDDVPESWPRKIKTIAMEDLIPEGQLKAVVWFANTNGSNWQRFYAFAIDYYLDEIKLEPAFIYKRYPAESGMAYVPVVNIMLGPGDIVAQSSKMWCQSVFDEIERAEGASEK